MRLSDKIPKMSKNKIANIQKLPFWIEKIESKSFRNSRIRIVDDFRLKNSFFYWKWNFQFFKIHTIEARQKAALTKRRKFCIFLLIFNRKQKAKTLFLNLNFTIFLNLNFLIKKNQPISAWKNDVIRPASTEWFLCFFFFSFVDKKYLWLIFISQHNPNNEKRFRIYCQKLNEKQKVQ